ncbi:MAG: threonine synthase, partial [Firmicutes bacterium]|nr:threonine synthase [Bacillota bacterium]
CDRDAKAVKELFAALDQEGHYQMPASAVEKMQAVMVGEYATEAETLEAIGAMKLSDDYILDPHTAVAVKALEKYDAVNDRQGKAAVIDSTANPYKFNKAVYDGIHGAGAADDMDEFAVSQALTEETGMPIHRGLLDLDKKAIRHDKVVEKDGMKAIVAEILK